MMLQTVTKFACFPLHSELYLTITQTSITLSMIYIFTKSKACIKSNFHVKKAHNEEIGSLGKNRLIYYWFEKI